jgi:glycosyltransferase involved in cell wall biosynthesis
MKLAAQTVSVVIPCYNDGRFLMDAVQSVEQCGDGVGELIVVNDGSTDAITKEVLASVESRGHRVLHQENGGLASARNRGIATSRGNYILPLDADNRIRPAYPARGMEIMERDSGIAVVYGDPEFFGERAGRKHIPEFNLRQLLEWNYIDACAVMRRSVWERCGGYDERMPVQGFEDWDLWCRIALNGGGFHHANEVLYDYRVRTDSMSSGMAAAPKVQAVMRHIRAKRIEVSIGDYLAAHQSMEQVVEQFHGRPVKTLISLILRAYFPGCYDRLRTKAHAKQDNADASPAE